MDRLSPENNCIFPTMLLSALNQSLRITPLYFQAVFIDQIQNLHLMKSLIMAWIIVSALLLISIGSIAQYKQKEEKRPGFPGWVSEKGYWVVESNQASPTDHIIRFYDNLHNLVYSEKLTGIHLNPEKKKVKMKLKKILEAAVLAYEENKGVESFAENGSIVRSTFR
jgi:hypothetical protein